MTVGQPKVSVANPRTCSSTHAPAAYASPHCTTLRRRSLVQVLSASRSAGVSVNRRPPWRRSVAAYPRVRAGNTSTVTGRPTRMLFLNEFGTVRHHRSAHETGPLQTRDSGPSGQTPSWKASSSPECAVMHSSELLLPLAPLPVHHFARFRIIRSRTSSTINATTPEKR